MYAQLLALDSYLTSLRDTSGLDAMPDVTISASDREDTAAVVRDLLRRRFPRRAPEPGAVQSVDAHTAILRAAAALDWANTVHPIPLRTTRRLAREAANQAQTASGTSQAAHDQSPDPAERRWADRLPSNGRDAGDDRRWSGADSADNVSPRDRPDRRADREREPLRSLQKTSSARPQASVSVAFLRYRF